MGKYATYQEYIDSEEWAILRKEALYWANYACEHCGWLENLDVHHIRYRGSWGNEKVSDLQVLCRRCHSRRHKGWGYR